MGQKVTELVTAREKELVAAFEVNPDDIAALREKFKDVTFDTPANYEVGRQALATLRGLRVKVEKTRVDLKADVLERGRLIDKTAKTFSKLVEDIEDPLIAAKKLVDDTEAKRKLDAERAELIALEAQQKAEREAAEAKAREERKAEEARLATERAALEAEKARQSEATRAIEESQRAEREKLAAERQSLEADRRRVEEADRKAREADAARARAEQAAQAKREAEEAAKAQAERLEALKPERQKVHDFADRIRGLAEDVPEVESEMCAKAIGWVVGRLCDIADTLDRFDRSAT